MNQEKILQGKYFLFRLTAEQSGLQADETHRTELFDIKSLVEELKGNRLLMFIKKLDEFVLQSLGRGVLEVLLSVSMENEENIVGCLNIMTSETNMGIYKRNPGEVPVTLPHFISNSTTFDTLTFSPSYPACKSPFKRFALCEKGELISCRRVSARAPWEVKFQEKSLLSQLLQERNDQKRVELLFDQMTDKDLLSKGCTMLHTVNKLSTWMPTSVALELEKPLCFPIWGQARLDELENHSCLANCELCAEKEIWTTLKHWYTEWFLTRQVEEGMMLADGTLIQKPARKKGLVMLGARGTGKTKFFQAICGVNMSRIIHVKNRFAKKQWKSLAEAWLILIDDFLYQEEKDIETFKALLASEETLIEGKWLSLHYPGGLPCVLLCNDQSSFKYFKENTLFKDQCLFIDLGSFFIGPPSFRKGKPSCPNSTRPNILQKRKTRRTQTNLETDDDDDDDDVADFLGNFKRSK